VRRIFGGDFGLPPRPTHSPRGEFKSSRYRLKDRNLARGQTWNLSFSPDSTLAGLFRSSTLGQNLGQRSGINFASTAAAAHERHCSLPAAMQITVGSYVRINEQCRNRAVRGLLCRVQALECRRLSAIVPTQFAQVRVLWPEDIQGDAPEWWTPCSAIRYVGDASSCIGTHDAQAAARCFLPFRLSTGAIECSLEVPHVPSRMVSVAARLRQARACSHVLRARACSHVSVRSEHTGRRTATPLALPILLPSEMRRLSAHEAQLATGVVSLLHRTGA
jgi:hypothetical protein